jgi:hypothetical protein
MDKIYRSFECTAECIINNKKIIIYSMTTDGSFLTADGLIKKLQLKNIIIHSIREIIKQKGEKI